MHGLTRSIAMLVLAVFVLAGSAAADTYTWEMDASEDQIRNCSGNPSPPKPCDTNDNSTDSTATGHAEISYDTDTGTLTYTVSWTDMEELLSAIHMHGPAGPDESNPAHLWDIFSTEQDVIDAGVDRTTDSVNDSVQLADLVIGFGTGAFDAATTLRYMVRERGYVNVHSQGWPMGEIRAHYVLTEANVTPTKYHEKCITTLNKSFAKVAKAQGKHICKCIKDGSNDAALDIEECMTTLSPKVAKAKAGTALKFDKKCGGFDKNGALKYPPYGATDAEIVNAVAVEKENGLIDDVFGSDIDLVISTTDPTASCQVAVIKSVKKCQGEKIKSFNKCKKDGFKGKAAPEGADLPFNDATDIELCMGDDPKGKIAKACVTKLDASIDKKCDGVDTDAAFPGCSGEDLGDCLDRLVECRVCEALNAVDDLNRDCDDFDDGMANGSCPSPSSPSGAFLDFPSSVLD
jgi:hypothetical protein